MWGPETDSTYPLRTYLRDLRLWSYAADVERQRLAPLACLRLTGQAKELAREFDPDILANGRLLADGTRQPGIEYMMNALNARFGVLAQELQIHVLREVLQFHRKSQESVDEALSRFALLLHRADEGGGIDFQPTVQSWLLLNGLNIPPKDWPQVLAQTQGALPETPDQYAALQNYLKRRGHLTEPAGGHIDPAKQFKGTQHYFIGEPVDNDISADNYAFRAASYSNFYQDGDATTAGELSDQTFDGFSEASSGWSHTEEPVDLEDVAHLDHNVAGEQLYMAYRFAKRRWRKFQGHPRRRRRFYPKGKGRGKGHGRGRSHRSFFMNDDPTSISQPCIVDTTWNHSPSIYAVTSSALSLSDSQSIFFKGNGKGGKGVRRGGNPLGRDGQPLRCSICESTEHLRAVCPRRGQDPQGKGKGSGSKGSSFSAPSFNSQSWPSDISSPAQSNYHASSVPSGSTQPQVWPSYFTEAQEIPHSSQHVELNWTDEKTAEFYIDGAHESVPIVAEKPSQLFGNTDVKTYKTKYLEFPCFLDTALIYHSNVRLPGRESLLVDIGAIINLCGKEVAERIQEEAKLAGQGTSIRQLDQNVSLEGVGSGATSANQEYKLPIKLENGEQCDYTALVLDGPLPALLGLNALERHGALICTATKRLIFPGPGGYKLALSPSSKILKLYKAPTGHLMLPCSEWNRKTVEPGGKNLGL